MCETVQSLMIANPVEPPCDVPSFKVFPHLMFDYSDPKSLTLVLNFLHSWLSWFQVHFHLSPNSPYTRFHYICWNGSTGKKVYVVWLENLYTSSKVHAHHHENFICYVCSQLFCQSMLDICTTVEWIQLSITSVNIVLT
jgi:hypothetical protein